MSIEDLIRKGSATARNGFKNEDDIICKFNNWKTDNEAQYWLIIMGYLIEEIEYVLAVKIRGEKTDVQVQITVKLKTAIDVQNIQVKLVSNLQGFNQIDKRWIDSYQKLWDIPQEVTTLLKLFTGELPPTIKNTRDSRRMFLDELSEKDRMLILEFFTRNKLLIINDILKGRGQLSAEWMLVVQKISSNARWVLKSINVVMNYYGNGGVCITRDGNIRIGKIGVQRKGGDAGRPTANMLQFKINPAKLFDL